MIKIIEGDILNCTEKIICQQVNCMGVMGKGLALKIKERYPEVYNGYKKMTNNFHNKKDLLGECMIACCYDGKYIANIFGQYEYGTDKMYTDYNALSNGFKKLNEHFSTFSIAIPYKIGCGLGGGDWDIVYGIINDIFKDRTDVTIYKYEPSNKYRKEVK